MTRIPFSSSAFAIVSFLVLAMPVSLAAQTRQRGTASAQGQAVPRSEGRSGGQSQGQGQGQGAFGAQAVPRAVPRAAPPQTGVPPLVGLPSQVGVPQVGAPQARAPQVVQPQTNTLRPDNRAVSRGNYRPDYRPDYRSNYRPDYRPQYRPSYRPVYRPSYRPYYRPYYTFLPRVRLGFGLWIGYPVTYPTYFYPYPAYPYAYTPSYPSASYPVPATPPTVGAAGGLSFEITPPEAGVYVDGLYIGTVDQFTPNQPPLSLAPGRHHVEIREPGFEIIAFDVDILPGQVIPYRGELRPF